MIIPVPRLLPLFRFWPPFMLSGISVKEHDLDNGIIVSQLKTRWWNANYFGTHFGGSLQAMCDPFYVMILFHALGTGYFLWDKETSIKFVKAIREPVTAKFEIPPAELAKIKRLAETGVKVEPSYSTEVLGPNGEVVAKVRKKLYIKSRSEAPAASNPSLAKAPQQRVSS